MPKPVAITDAEFDLLRAAAPADTLLPASWWAAFLSLFLNHVYTEREAEQLLELFNDRLYEMSR